jgi:hypothetical protein
LQGACTILAVASEHRLKMTTPKPSILVREEEQRENTGLRSRDEAQNLEVSSGSKQRKHGLLRHFQGMNSMKLIVLVILCLQNSLFTVLRRYSQGVLREVYSKVSLRLNKQSQ